MLTVVAEGTHTTAGTTEETLLTWSVPGRYRLKLDINALVGGATPDIYEVRVKTNARPGGVERVTYPVSSYVGGLSAVPVVLCPDEDDIYVSDTLTVTIQRVQGVDRAIPWALCALDPLRWASVVADAMNSAISFKTDLSETATDHWKRAFVAFVSGALRGQVSKVSTYDGTTKFLTVEVSFTAAPAAGDRFVLVYR